MVNTKNSNDLFDNFQAACEEQRYTFSKQKRKEKCELFTPSLKPISHVTLSV
jgi:hypothetical protein